MKGSSRKYKSQGCISHFQALPDKMELYPFRVSRVNAPSLGLTEAHFCIPGD